MIDLEEAYECFECGQPADFEHHVVPRILGGTKTVSLCNQCHAKVHGLKSMQTGTLTSKAMQLKRERGEYTGGQPEYGYDVGEDGVLVQNEEEQQAIEIAKELVDAGFSYRGAGKALADIGYLSRTGRPFVPQVIKKMVGLTHRKKTK